MSFRWNSVPLFRFLLAYLAGVILQIFLPGYLFAYCLLFAVSVAGLLLFTYVKALAVNYPMRHVFGLFSVLTFFSTGSIVTWINTPSNYSHHYIKAINHTASLFVGTLNETPVEKTSSYKTVMSVRYVECRGVRKKVNGLLLLYLEKDSAIKNFRYGDEIAIKAIANDIPEPQNPAEFNYKRYLKFHQIYRQAYVSSESIKFISSGGGNPLIRIADRWRHALVEKIRQSIPDKRHYAVAEALAVGYEDDLDQELIQAFASAGALHVLSVSGMHVGLIFMSLLLLFKWTENIKHTQHFKYTVILLIIWLYALIAGMSPSVMRSAVMITLIIMAGWTRRSTSLYNSLAVSAFGLLLYNPYYITEVGFQLSYAAVFGIVYLHPMIFRWFEPEGFILSNIWSITSVSIAAQTLTFPLGLLYFHQFPNLFVISNLIIIPLSTFVIYGSIIMLAFSWIPVVSLLVGKVLWGIIWLINQSVFLVDTLPYSIVNGISISVFETWVLYLIVFLFVSFLSTKRALFLNVSLACICFVLLAQLAELVNQKQQLKLFVYNVKHQKAINVIDGRKGLFIADSGLASDKSKMLFHVVHNWWDLGLAEKQIITEDKLTSNHSLLPKVRLVNNHLRLNNINIVLVDTGKWYIEKIPLHYHYVIVSHNAWRQLFKLDVGSDTMVIVDSSNNKNTVKKIVQYCRDKSIRFYNVASQGAFELSI